MSVWDDKVWVGRVIVHRPAESRAGVGSPPRGTTTLRLTFDPRTAHSDDFTCWCRPDVIPVFRWKDDDDESLA